MLATKLAPFFEPLQKPYTACVLTGVNAGRVVQVTGLGKANAMLTFCEFEPQHDESKCWSVERANQLVRV